MSASLTGPAFRPPDDMPATVSDLIVARLQQNPNAQFVEIDYAGERRTLAAAVARIRSQAVLAALRDNVEAGAADIVLCFDSALDLIPAAWACLDGGYGWLPWQLSRHPTVEDLRAKLQLFADKLDRPLLLATREVLMRLAAVEPLPFATLLVDLDDGASRQLCNPLAAPSPGSAPLLMMTSGTTGSAKIAVLDQRSLLNRHLSWPKQPPGMNRLYCFPFDGTSGFWVLFPGAGDNIFLQPERLAAQPLELLDAVSSFGLNSLALSTSMAVRLLQAVQKHKPSANLCSLEHIGLGGEMIAPPLMLELGRELCALGAEHLKVSFAYGMTETGPICATPRMTIEELVALLSNDGQQASLGGCVTGWSLRIVDDDNKGEPEGVEGNIEVWSSARLFAGYKGEPALNAENFAADGWFKTGDRGRIQHGALCITGRRKSTIIINARKLALESIEAPLQSLKGIRAPLLAAAAIRTADSVTDELGIFFVPEKDTSLDGLCRSIVQIVGRQRLAVSHLVPLSEEQFPLTATGKVKRSELVRLYQTGELRAHRRRRGRAGARGERTETERWLAELWRSMLDLDFTPSPSDDFIELGADSFASAELIFAVEERFSCNLPVESFFERPTIANLASLIEQHRTTPSESAGGGVTSRPVVDRVLHRIQAYVGGWKGQRLFEDSLVIGFNIAGRRPPIFWVFQSHKEAKALAKQLGPDQPLYAMRSCVEIVRIRDYTTEVVETVCNRYLWEILALRPEGELIIGGNCQGGILALAMARRLKQAGLKPLRLVLLEWSYSYGAYLEPALLIYADGSATAKIYTEPGEQKINWRRDFPRGTVASIPGRHGVLFSDKASLAGLAGLLIGESGRSGVPRPARPRLRLWG